MSATEHQHLVPLLTKKITLDFRKQPKKNHLQEARSLSLLLGFYQERKRPLRTRPRDQDNRDYSRDQREREKNLESRRGREQPEVNLRDSRMQAERLRDEEKKRTVKERPKKRAAAPSLCDDPQIQRAPPPPQKKSEREKKSLTTNSTTKNAHCKNAPSTPQVFIMQLERLSSVGSLHPPPLIDLYYLVTQEPVSLLF